MDGVPGSRCQEKGGDRQEEEGVRGEFLVQPEKWCVRGNTAEPVMGSGWGYKKSQNRPCIRGAQGTCGHPTPAFSLEKGAAKAPKMEIHSQEKCSAFLITEHIPEIG